MSLRALCQLNSVGAGSPLVPGQPVKVTPPAPVAKPSTPPPEKGIKGPPAGGDAGAGAPPLRRGSAAKATAVGIDGAGSVTRKPGEPIRSDALFCAAVGSIRGTVTVSPIMLAFHTAPGEDRRLPRRLHGRMHCAVDLADVRSFGALSHVVGEGTEAGLVPAMPPAADDGPHPLEGDGGGPDEAGGSGDGGFAEGGPSTAPAWGGDGEAPVAESDWLPPALAASHTYLQVEVAAPRRRGSSLRPPAAPAFLFFLVPEDCIGTLVDVLEEFSPARREEFARQRVSVTAGPPECFAVVSPSDLFEREAALRRRMLRAPPQRRALMRSARSASSSAVGASAAPRRPRVSQSGSAGSLGTRTAPGPAAARSQPREDPAPAESTFGETVDRFMSQSIFVRSLAAVGLWGGGETEKSTAAAAAAEPRAEDAPPSRGRARTREAAAAAEEEAPSGGAKSGDGGGLLSFIPSLLGADDDGDDGAPEASAAAAARRAREAEAHRVHEAVAEPPRMEPPHSGPLLGRDTARRVRAHLPVALRAEPWRLAYRASAGSRSIERLLAGAREASATVLVVQTEGGRCLGAFLPVRWRPMDSFEGGEGAFVFSRVHRPNMTDAAWASGAGWDVWHATGRNNSVLMASPDGFMIGAGNAIAIAVDRSLWQGTSGPSDTFGNAPLVPAQHFRVGDVELWAVGGDFRAPTRHAAQPRARGLLGRVASPFGRAASAGSRAGASPLGRGAGAPPAPAPSARPPAEPEGVGDILARLEAAEKRQTRGAEASQAMARRAREAGARGRAWGGGVLGRGGEAVHNPRELGGRSRILSADQRMSVGALLPVHTRVSDWRLLYSLTRHGVSMETFFSRIRGESPTLLIVKTDAEEVFGGYASEAWDQSGKYSGTGESFVFRVTPSVEAYRWTGDNMYWMLGEAEAVMMGGGGDFAFRINGDFEQGTTGASETFGNPPLTNNTSFVCVEVEAWALESPVLVHESDVGTPRP